MACEKSFGRSVRLVLLVSVCWVTATASAQDMVVFSMNGQRQGVIAGEMTNKGFEGKFRALSVNYGITSTTAISLTAGPVVGKAQLGPFRITRESGRGSTQLFHAMVTGEGFSEVRVDFYRTAPTGVQVLSQSYRLPNAILASYVRVHAPSEQGIVKTTDVLELVSPAVEVIDVEKNTSSSYRMF